MAPANVDETEPLLGLGATTEFCHERRQSLSRTRDDIPFDLITAEKVPAEVYVDDRAIRFAPGDWPAITDWILWSGDGAGR